MAPPPLPTCEMRAIGHIRSPGVWEDPTPFAQGPERYQGFLAESTHSRVALMVAGLPSKPK